jgi:hypothetical protein
MTSEPDAFSIVVLGALTPPIHHPLWYTDAGLLTPAEADEALRSPTFLCTRDAAEFSFGGLRVRCTRSRWSVHATGLLDRLLDLAARTHARLRDTPVTGFGLNFDYVRNVGEGPDVVAILVRAAHDAPLGLPGEGALDASFTYRRKLGDAVVSVLVAPGESPRQVQVKNNFYHELEPGAVALDALIRQSFPDARVQAEAQLARTLRALGPGRRG